MDDDPNNLIEEMTRFEAEIASKNHGVIRDPSRPIIGASTYTQVQQQLDGFPAPRLPRLRFPQNIPSGPAPPLVPMSLQPPLPPAGFPMGGQSTPAVFAGIPPPPPPPSFLIPHQVRGSRPMPPARPPPPPSMMGPRKPGPVVLSAAPTKYRPPQKKSKIDDELNEFLNEIKKEEEKISTQKTEKSSAKLMAEQVKANTVVSVHSSSSTATEEHDQHQQGHSGKPKKEKKTKKTVRSAGGQVWEDNSLVEWEDDDFRIFCGDLGNDVTDDILIRAFNKYPSFLKAKVVRDKRTNKTKGFGFVSFKDPQDFIKAMKEMNGRYVGSRPIKLRKSCWKQRSLDAVKKKEKEKVALINLLTGRTTQ